MFEYQGWATLRPTFLNSERHDDDRFPEGFEEVLTHHIGALHNPDNEVAVSVVQNGSQRVVFYGDRNHQQSVMPRIEALLSFLVENAEGSYGEFGFIDWSSGGSERWLMRRGMLIKGPHPDFLPLQPNIEDFYSKG